MNGLMPNQSTAASSRAIPTEAGIGLRGPHMEALLQSLPAVGWLEAHSENYFGGSGVPLYYLLQAREHYPVSLHGVGLSLGSTDPLCRSHLARLRQLIDQVQPGLVSEHLSWGSVSDIHFNDLLPLPYTEEALDHFCQRVSQVQEALGRTLLIENPSSYLRYRHSTIAEWEFLDAICERTGALLLLDINNVFVSAFNHGFDAQTYLKAIPAKQVAEIHLAGHSLKQFEDGALRIDDHASPVCEDVWALYRQSLQWLGPKPTLIEWDVALPPLPELVDQARIAQDCLDNLSPPGRGTRS
ncbi:MNIO family bufferin maturase [Marinobacterium rhizophilum]|uniref:UPF0276 protein KDW95_21970 n=1 Tax=Marinobacterium rhizophilum TaxID=420402 RepID=A0ABY5HHP8_9GAMM|nr:DUF692 domain-containing protein [Marinobacterium rhizophilum]UTW11878.1 DUF692 domain-containing protein [Marinobacterium rhizophilum]